MDLRVASIVLLMAALAAAHGKGYVVKKVVKAPPQYQPYSVKSQGKKAPPSSTLCITLDFLFSLLRSLSSPDPGVDDLHLPSELHLWSFDCLHDCWLYELYPADFEEICVVNFRKDIFKVDYCSCSCRTLKMCFSGK